jgi:hypothetical protein
MDLKTILYIVAAVIVLLVVIAIIYVLSSFGNINQQIVETRKAIGDTAVYTKVLEVKTMEKLTEQANSIKQITQEIEPLPKIAKRLENIDASFEPISDNFKQISSTLEQHHNNLYSLTGDINKIKSTIDSRFDRMERILMNIPKTPINQYNDASLESFSTNNNDNSSQQSLALFAQQSNLASTSINNKNTLQHQGYSQSQHHNQNNNRSQLTPLSPINQTNLNHSSNQLSNNKSVSNEVAESRNLNNTNLTVSRQNQNSSQSSSHSSSNNHDDIDDDIEEELTKHQKVGKNS